MTREEAIKELETIKMCEVDTVRQVQALDVALTALRPVSRDQVEKVFGGKWEEETYTTVSGRGRVIHSKKCTCSACGKANGRAKTNFCPACGRAMTDEAVEMVMERVNKLEGMKNELD